MFSIVVRELSSRNPDDLLCELDYSVSQDDVIDFIENCAYNIFSIKGLGADLSEYLHRNFGSAVLSGSNNYLLLSVSEALIRCISDSELQSSLWGVINNQKKRYKLSNKHLSKMNKCTLVMGVLNVTPDSFSDGGKFFEIQEAIARAKDMVEAGADIIDIGGESTRPGAAFIEESEELRRVIPVIEALRTEDVVLSVDTSKSVVAQAACAAGADMINDISAGTIDGNMPKIAAKAEVAVVLMHIRGTPKEMQLHTNYRNVIAEVYEELLKRCDVFKQAGCDPNSLIIDPGFGFSKTPAQNLEILRRLSEFKSMGQPILIGPSRKSTIGKVLDNAPEGKRLEGTVAAVCIAIANGANIVRVHDVKEIKKAVQMVDAIVGKCFL